MEPETEISEKFRIPDAMWEQRKPLLPKEPEKPKGGRPRNDDRQMMVGLSIVDCRLMIEKIFQSSIINHQY